MKHDLTKSKDSIYRSIVISLAYDCNMMYHTEKAAPLTQTQGSILIHDPSRPQNSPTSPLNNASDNADVQSPNIPSLPGAPP
jgi:hypothetical protein